eukprot:comp16826_c0_seq1/m.15253 comp16826_c0_seq1/g.15253  ORF comp16826_c0_seq1/g.15253 comp16826_c0_seq1/m.15253 type:complete len:501 (-) comp16826_c0_seq1:407-1909(-)
MSEIGKKRYGQTRWMPRGLLHNGYIIPVLLFSLIILNFLPLMVKENIVMPVFYLMRYGPARPFVNGTYVERDISNYDNNDGTWPVKHCFLPNDFAPNMERYINESMGNYTAGLTVKSRNGGWEKCLSNLEELLKTEFLASEGLCDFNKFEMPTFPVEAMGILPGEHPIKMLQKLPQEKNVPKIAFLIMAFMDGEQVRALFNRIYHRQHIYIIQISPDSDDSFRQEMKQLVSQHPNAFLLDWGNVVYGSAMDIEFMLAVAKYFLEEWENWEFFVPLGGSDYPVYNISTFHDLLVRTGPYSWVPGQLPLDSYTPHAKFPENGECLNVSEPHLGPPPHHLWDRAGSFYYRCIEGNKHYPGKPLPRKQWWFLSEKSLWCKTYGLNHGIFTRKAMNEMVNSERGKKAYYWFRYVRFSSNEHFFGSFLMSYPDLRAEVVRKTPCFMSWTHGKLSVRNAGVGNTVLTMGEAYIIDDARRNEVPFVRKLHSHVPESAALRAYIDQLDN